MQCIITLNGTMHVVLRGAGTGQQEEGQPLSVSMPTAGRQQSSSQHNSLCTAAELFIRANVHLSFHSQTDQCSTTREFSTTPLIILPEIPNTLAIK